MLLRGNEEKVNVACRITMCGEKNLRNDMVYVWTAMPAPMTVGDLAETTAQLGSVYKYTVDLLLHVSDTQCYFNQRPSLRPRSLLLLTTAKSNP